MKVKERRVIDSSLVRHLCIDKKWYTCGDCVAYDELLSKCTKLGHKKVNMTAGKLLEIALDIYNHSDINKIKSEYGCSDNEVLENMLYELNSVACFTFFDIVEE